MNFTIKPAFFRPLNRGGKPLWIAALAGEKTAICAVPHGRDGGTLDQSLLHHSLGGEAPESYPKFPNKLDNIDGYL